MATRTRDTAPGKDKKLASTSKQPNSGQSGVGAPPTAARRKSIANPMPSASASASTPLQKRTSNNLTLPGKKPVSGSSDIANKKTVVRRRSLDKLPTPSNAQSPRGSQSPTVRRASISGRTPQARASLSPTPQPLTGRPAIQSSMGRSTPSPQKAVPDRSMKVPKEAVGKQYTLQSRPANLAKKNTKTGVKKLEAGRGGPSATKERPRISPREKADDRNMQNAPEVEIEGQDQVLELSSTVAAEQQKAPRVEIDTSNEKGHGDPAMDDQEKGAYKMRLEDQEVINDQQTEETQKGDEEDQIVPAESSTISEPKDAVFFSVESETGSEPKNTEEANMVSEPKEVETMTPQSSKISHNNGSTISTNKTEDKSHVKGLTEKSINEPANITPVESAASKSSQDTNAKENVEETTTRGEAREPEEIKAKEVVAETDNVNGTVPGGEAPQPEEIKEKEPVVEKKEEHEESKTKEVAMKSNNVKEKVEETVTRGEAPKPEETKPEEVVAEKKEEEKSAPRVHHWKLQKKDSTVSNDAIKETEEPAPRPQVVAKLQKDSAVFNDAIKETEEPTPRAQVVAKLQKKDSAVSNGVVKETEEPAPRAQVVAKLQKKDSAVSNDAIKETEEPMPRAQVVAKLQKKDSAVSNDAVKETEEPAPRAQEVAKLQRKDSAVSNDVIEETASKLREQRKNRVRALAGAFETVISLQDSKS